MSMNCVWFVIAEKKCSSLSCPPVKVAKIFFNYVCRDFFFNGSQFINPFIVCVTNVHIERNYPFVNEVLR